MNVDWREWRDRAAEIAWVAMEKSVKTAALVREKAMPLFHTALEKGMAPHLAPMRRRVVAGAASVATHLLLFLVLALTTGEITTDARKPESPSAEETPLEIVFLSPPEEKRETIPLPEPQTYQLDPANLKESATPPEEATLLAAHHSEGQANPVPQLRTNAAAEPSGGDLAAAPANEAEEAESVAAMGVWKKAVADAIGLRWDHYRKARAASLATGSVRLTFRIDAGGEVSDIKILSNSGNPNNALLAVRSAKEARIPPIPADRLRKLPGGKVDVELTLTILPNP